MNEIKYDDDKDDDKQLNKIQQQTEYEYEEFLKNLELDVFDFLPQERQFELMDIHDRVTYLIEHNPDLANEMMLPIVENLAETIIMSVTEEWDIQCSLTPD